MSTLHILITLCCLVAPSLLLAAALKAAVAAERAEVETDESMAVWYGESEE